MSVFDNTQADNIYDEIRSFVVMRIADNKPVNEIMEELMKIIGESLSSALYDYETKDDYSEEV